ncbi:hypothetical protein [Intrasporangium sp.]|uniref:hypothetical protein n=1 Tax=Intrasporangium sp. TaxID=1925024 RepID=UPI00322209C5
MTGRPARPDDERAVGIPAPAAQALPTARGQRLAARSRFAIACRASAVLAGDPAGAQLLREAAAAGTGSDEGEPTDGRP